MISRLLRWARITLGGSDTLQHPQQQVGYTRKVADAVVLQPYGVHGNIPEDTLVLLGVVGGADGDKVILGVMPPDRQTLPEGEVTYYHPATGTRIHLRNSGAIEIDTSGASGQITITTGGGAVNLDTGGGALTATVGAAAVTATSVAVTSPTVSVVAATSVAVTTPAMTVSGNLAIGGTLSSVGNATISGKDFLAHTHGGVQTGAGSTGGVN